MGHSSRVPTGDNRLRIRVNAISSESLAWGWGRAAILLPDGAMENDWTTALICFALGSLGGLGVGLGLWWQQRQRLRQLLRRLQVNRWSEALPALAQLNQRQWDDHQQLQGIRSDLSSRERILEAAPVGYLQVDRENQLLWCNLEASRLLGMEQRLQGNLPKPRLLLELARSYELDALIEEARTQGTEQTKDWLLYRISPDPLNPMQEPTAPLRGHAFVLNHGEVGVFLENRQEAALLVQQRDRWTSDVAHELKTPLTSIRLVAETLQPKISPGLRGWIDRLLNETIRLSNLVEDLLNLSRLEGGQFEGLTLKSVDLPHLVQVAWQSLEPLARVKHLELHYSGPSELPIQLDAPLFHRVLINLIDNAIKHSPPRGIIYSRLSMSPPTASVPTVCLDIIDTGPGFHDRDLPHVFDRFYRADPARSRSTDGAAGNGAAGSSRGSGLGLAIVQQIIEAHHGQVSAHNHPELGGAWLQIQLPAQLMP